nr:hypothetical protein [Ruania alba]
MHRACPHVAVRPHRRGRPRRSVRRRDRLHRRASSGTPRRERDRRQRCHRDLGELFSAAAKGRGAVAAVTDGAVRDRAKIQAVGFPVYSATCRPNDFRGRMRVESVGERVTFHGIEISDGDLLAIDDDGMAVVPQAHEQEVLSLARERATAESDVLADLLAGETLSSVWERYRIL